MNARITLPELVALVADATHTTKRMSELFLREFFATVAEALVAGENVTVKDLGTFKVQPASAGTVSGRVLAFVPAKRLAEQLNQPFEAFVAITLDDDIDVADLDAAATAPETASDENAATAEPIESPSPATRPENPAPMVPPPFVEPAHEEKQPTGQGSLTEIEPQRASVAPTDTLVAAPTPEAPPAPAESPVEPPRHLDKPGGHTDQLTLQLLEQVKREASRKSLWKGALLGLVAGVLCTLALTHLPTTADAPHPQADTTATAQAASPDSTTDETTVITAEPQVTDTISKTMYLTKMAIKHYGRQEFWVYIYEENKAMIDNPNNIKPGTVLVIPPAAKYGIDPNNDESVAKAKKISFELFSKYK